jgi:hypothetical protein
MSVQISSSDSATLYAYCSMVVLEFAVHWHCVNFRNWREPPHSMVCACNRAAPQSHRRPTLSSPCSSGFQHVGDQRERLSSQVLTLGLLMGNQQQQSLARRRASPAACRAGASGSDRITSFVLNITLWRLLSLAGLPLRQIVSWYLFTGRSCWALVVDLQRWLWRAVGWLSAPPRSAALQRFGSPLLDVRRWHYGLGEFLNPETLSDACHLATKQSQRLLCDVPRHQGGAVLRTWSSSGVIGGCRVSTCPAQPGCSKSPAVLLLDSSTYASMGLCGRRT